MSVPAYCRLLPNGWKHGSYKEHTLRLTSEDFNKDLSELSPTDCYLLAQTIPQSGPRTMIEVIVLKVLSERTDHFQTLASVLLLDLKRMSRAEQKPRHLQN